MGPFSGPFWALFGHPPGRPFLALFGHFAPPQPVPGKWGIWPVLGSPGGGGDFGVFGRFWPFSTFGGPQNVLGSGVLGGGGRGGGGEGSGQPDLRIFRKTPIHYSQKLT